MASPQTRNLKTANGGKVAPQHYNDAMGDFEYSKGSDGALHTKVINQPSVTLVDKNGNQIDSGNKLPVDVTFPAEQAVKDTDVLTKLAEIESKIQATNDRLNQTLNTQLTGSKVQQKKIIVLANSLAISDTNYHYYDGSTWTDSLISIPNWNDYNRHMLHVHNTHDQPVKLSLLTKTRNNGLKFDVAYLGVGKTEQSITIPANLQFSPILITKNDMPLLEGIQAYDVSFRLKCDTAPTTGSLLITVIMWAE